MQDFRTLLDWSFYRNSNNEAVSSPRGKDVRALKASYLLRAEESLFKLLDCVSLGGLQRRGVLHQLYLAGC